MLGAFEGVSNQRVNQRAMIAISAMKDAMRLAQSLAYQAIE